MGGGWRENMGGEGVGGERTWGGGRGMGILRERSLGSGKLGYI